MPRTTLDWFGLTACYVMVGLLLVGLVERDWRYFLAAVLLGAVAVVVAHFCEDAPHAHL